MLARRERTFMAIPLDLMAADAALGALDESVGCVGTRGDLGAFHARTRTIGHRRRASVAMRSKTIMNAEWKMISAAPQRPSLLAQPQAAAMAASAWTSLTSIIR